REPESGLGSLHAGHCARSQLFRRLRWARRQLQPAAGVLAMPGNEAYFKAFAAARKAVELDQQSSEAHASLAFVTFFGMWDAAGAEKEFRRAIELDPNNVKAHHWYATFLPALGRHEEALTEIDLARKLDPDSS